MQLLAGTDTDGLDLTFRADGLGDIGDVVAGDLGHENLSAPHMFQCIEYEVYTLVQRDVEARHTLVGYGENALGPLLQEEGDHAASGAHHVAVANNGETDVVRAFEVVGRHEQLVRAQLRRTVEVDRACRFVGRKSHHTTDFSVYGTFDDVLSAQDVRLDGLERVVLRYGHMLESRSVHDGIYPLHRPIQTVFVTHVADEVADGRVLVVREDLRHLELLEFVARVDDETGDVRIGFEYAADERLAERTGAACDEDGPAVQHLCLSCRMQDLQRIESYQESACSTHPFVVRRKCEEVLRPTSASQRCRAVSQTTSSVISAFGSSPLNIETRAHRPSRRPCYISSISTWH